MEGAAMLWLLRFPRRTQAQPSAKQESYPCGLRCGAGARQGGRAWSRGNLAPNPPTWAAAAPAARPSKGRFERCACCAKARLIPDLHHRACYLRTHSRQGLLFAGWVKGLCSMGFEGAGGK
jgi:hypothetical protein